MIWMNLHPAIIAGNILLAVIDIVIITYIFFKFYQILAQTRAVQVVRGLLFFLVLYVLSKILQFIFDGEKDGNTFAQKAVNYLHVNELVDFLEGKLTGESFHKFLHMAIPNFRLR